MRYEEYARDRHSVRAAAMQIESAEKDLDLNDLSNIQLVLPVQAVAIGCHAHICRGQTDGPRAGPDNLRPWKNIVDRFQSYLEMPQ